MSYLGMIAAISLLLVASVFVVDAYAFSPSKPTDGRTTITSTETVKSISTLVISGTITTITQSGSVTTKTIGGTTLTSTSTATKTFVSTSTLTQAQTSVQTSYITVAGTTTVVKTSTVVSPGPTSTATITFTVTGTTAAPGLYALQPGVLNVLVYHVLNYGSQQTIEPLYGATVTVQEGVQCLDVACITPTNEPVFYYYTYDSKTTTGPDFNGAAYASFSGLTPRNPVIVSVTGPVGTVAGGDHKVFMWLGQGNVDTWFLQESSGLASTIKLGVVGSSIGMSSPMQEIIVALVLAAAVLGVLYIDRE